MDITLLHPSSIACICGQVAHHNPPFPNQFSDRTTSTWYKPFHGNVDLLGPQTHCTTCMHKCLGSIMSHVDAPTAYLLCIWVMAEWANMIKEPLSSWFFVLLSQNSGILGRFNLHCPLCIMSNLTLLEQVCHLGNRSCHIVEGWCKHGHHLFVCCQLFPLQC